MRVILKYGFAALLFLNISQASAQTEEQRGIRNFVNLLPVGDHVHVDVYDFIVDDLIKAKKRSRTQILEEVEVQKKVLKNASLKPLIASISESQMSHILRSLCKSDSSCLSVSVFDQVGSLHAIGAVDHHLIGSDIREIYLEQDLLNRYLKGEENPVGVVLPYPEQLRHSDLHSSLEQSPEELFNCLEIIYPIFLDPEGVSSLSNPQNPKAEIVGFLRLLRLNLREACGH